MMNSTTTLTNNSHDDHLLPSPQDYAQYVTDDSDDDQQSASQETMNSDEDADTMMMLSNTKGVTFVGSDQILEIPSRETYSPEEKQAAYYRKDDFQQMKRCAFESIQWHRSGGDNNSLEHSMRGLEGRTQDGFNIVRNNRLQAAYAVIDEQDRQDEIGVCDSMMLAEVYQRTSLSCKCLALARGLMDAQEVMNVGVVAAEQQQQGGAAVHPQEAVPSANDLTVLGQNILLFLAMNNNANAGAEYVMPPKEDSRMFEDSNSTTTVQDGNVNEATPVDSMMDMDTTMEWTAAEA